jgi:hypothetical protein
LFRYDTNSYIPKHKDPANGRRIYRLNLEIVKAKSGGEFVCNKLLWSWANRVYVFRADNSYHYVTRVEQGSRWVISLGIKLKSKQL